MQNLFTLEEIDEIMPSREIDGIIAERYLGWHVGVMSDSKKEDWFEALKECRKKEFPFDLLESYGGDFYGKRIPYFTSKIEDAWALDNNEFNWTFKENIDKLLVSLETKGNVLETSVFWNEVGSSIEAYALCRSRCILKLNYLLVQ